MKISLIIFSLLFIFNIYTVSFAQPTARDFDGIVGAVKHVEEEVAEMKMKDGQLIESSRRRYRSTDYDKQGRMTRNWISVTVNGSKEEHFSYDKQGNASVRSEIFSPSISDKPFPSSAFLNTFKFDESENTLTKEVYVGNTPSPRTLTQKYKYQFDTNNRLVETIAYTVQGSIAIKDVYEYGVGRFPTERRLYLTGNPTPQVIKYNYILDEQGNWIKRIEDNTLANQDRTQLTKITYRKISYFKQ